MEWSKVGNVERELKKKTKWLEDLQREEGPGNMAAIKELQGEIKFMLEQEDLRWKG